MVNNSTISQPISARGAQLQRSLAMTLQHLAEHERVAPSEVDAILAMLVAHVRSWKPASLLAGGGL